MSERLRSTSQVSNEEVIEDLTKELKTSLSVDSSGEEFLINPSSSTDNNPGSGDSKIRQETDVKDTPFVDPQLDLEDSKEKDKSESDTDSIDEVTLKDAEIDLTDDQKAERKFTAEELKAAGNKAFQDGEFERSIEKYTAGLKMCPLQFSQLRAIIYCNRSAAKMKLKKYDQAIKDCTKAIELDEKYVKAYLRRAQSYEASEKLDESLADFKKVVELDPSSKEANSALVRLPPLIEEKNEKLKTEMLGKLKDLGNMILKPFGLSTENFQMEQDPETKGYKINFKQ